MMDQNVLSTARHGNVSQLKRLLTRKKSRHLFQQAMSPQNNRALHIAARSGHTDSVREMIARHPFLVFAKNERGETPLHVAARAGHVDVVKIFIEFTNNRSVGAQDGDGENTERYSDPETRRIERDEIGIEVEEIEEESEQNIDYEAIEDDQQEHDTDSEAEEEDEQHNVLKMKDKGGNTPLHCAVRNNRLKVVSLLAVEDHELLLLENLTGESPLSIAIDLKLSEIACTIISLNPNTLHHKDHYKRTPLHCAVKVLEIGIVEKILKHHEIKYLVKELDQGERNCLHYAAALGHLEMVRMLLDKDASLAYEGDRWNQQTPLHLAAINGRVNVLRELLHRSPDTIELLDEAGCNVLHLATINGNLNVISFLMELSEIDDLVNAPDGNGNTPLHLAAKHFRSGLAYFLSRNPMVEIRAKNKDGKTALEIVQLSKSTGMQKHLTLRALKRAFAKRGLDPEDILEIRGLDANEHEHEDGKNNKEMARTLSVMSTLIATFTFTAAFTIPGGFNNGAPNEGMAVLIHRAAFKAFVITDTIAMTSSMTAAVLLFWSLTHNNDESFWDLLPFAIVLTWTALVAMSLAFVTGLFAVLSNTLWLAIVVCVIGCASPAILYLFAPIFLFLFDLLSSSEHRHRNLVDENPFLFVFRLVKMMI